MVRRAIFVINVFLILSGCSCLQTQDKVSLPEMRDSLVWDFHKMGEDMGLSDLTGKHGDRNRERAESLIRALQCKFDNPNPMVSLAGDVTFGLKGTFSSSGGIKASGTPEIGFQVSTGTEQGVTLTLRFMALSAIPDTYLDSHLKRMQALKDYLATTGAPPKDLPYVLKSELDEIIATYGALKQRVDFLEKSYRPDQCPKK
jgi:hypothetical protein